MIYLRIHEIRMISLSIWEPSYYDANTTKYASIHINVCFLLVLVIFLDVSFQKKEFESTHWNIQAILDFHVPSNLLQIQKIQGKANFLRRFIPN